jgi:carboxyl-terminal processing protease
MFCRSFVPGMLVVAALLNPSAVADESKKDELSDYELHQAFADTLDQIERNYVKPINRRELMEAAIQGVLGKLDPYSSYISPDDLGRFKTSVENQFGGIGIQITVDRGQLKVLSPLVGTPAYRAGVQAGDAIVEIEGQPTEGVSIDEAVQRLKGDAGSQVKLTVVHPDGKRESLTIVREMIHVETVLGDHRKPDDSWDFMLDTARQIGYIRLSAFSRDTAEDLRRAVKGLQAAGLKGLVIDLRFNPGGLLTAAVDVSDLFVSEGKIVSTQGRNVPERSWEAKADGTFAGFPMAVLVNRYSASASEIVSACLQDHKRAVVVGERTWGKGSVQNVVELEGGRSALKLTTASYQRPNGHNIHRFPDAKESDEWGVVPDAGYEVKLTDAEMTDLVRDRRERDIVAGKPSSPDKPAEPPAEKPADPPGDSSDQPPASPGSEAAPPPAEAAPPSKAPFVDRQLQKALEYLNQELARAR